MANDGDTPIPVWGIEVGSGALRAVRAVRREPGGYDLLAYEEILDQHPGPESLVAFIRRRGLKKHPLVIAIASPMARLQASRLAMESMGMDDEDTRSELLEFIHHEPELVEFRHLDLGGYRYLLSAEDRTRVEGYIATLEGAGIPAYALTTSLETMLRGLRDHGLVPGDAVIVRVEPHWTDLILLEGESIAHQGLPIGRTDLDAPNSDAVRRSFGADLGKMIEYQRHRKSHGRDDLEAGPTPRLLLLGLPPESAAALAPHLPGELLELPAENPLIAGRGRIDGARAGEILRLAPGAVGAAIAGTASPRRLELAFRTLPGEISAPRGPVALWLAAAAMLLLAAGAAFLGISAENRDLSDALGRLQKPRIIFPTRQNVLRLDHLSRAARLRLTLPVVTTRVLQALPDAGAAPYRTERLEFVAREDGGFDTHLAVRFDEVNPDVEAWRIRSWLETLETRHPGEFKVEPGEGGLIVHLRFTVKGVSP